MSSQGGKEDPRKASKFTPLVGSQAQTPHDGAKAGPPPAQISSFMTYQRTTPSAGQATKATEFKSISMELSIHEQCKERLLALDPRFRQSVYLEFHPEGEPQLPADQADSVEKVVAKAEDHGRIGQLIETIRRAEYLADLFTKP